MNLHIISPKKKLTTEIKMVFMIIYLLRKVIQYCLAKVCEPLGKRIIDVHLAETKYIISLRVKIQPIHSFYTNERISVLLGPIWVRSTNQD